MKKREWIYVQKPAQYEITCDKCECSNIEWSEFEGMIWCYDCEVDTKGTGGVFSGPIPFGAAGLLGLSFDRIILETKEYQKCVQNKDGSCSWVPGTMTL